LWKGRLVWLDPEQATANTKIDLFTFVGPLLSRRVVENAGLPREDYFISFDDQEYALRIKKAGFASLLVPNSIIFHSPAGGPRTTTFLGRKIQRKPLQPAWKAYYDARNHLYTITRSFNGLNSYGWYAAQHSKRFLRDFLLEQDRWARTRFRFLGMVDGLTGRLERRF
jgi:GT2 family glycosyltransferase